MESYLTEKNKPNWEICIEEKECYINKICQNCGEVLDHNFKVFIGEKTLKIFCDNCIAKNGISSDYDDIPQFSLGEIHLDLLRGLLDKKGITKFISGNNLYINFSFMVKNYRDKIEFCNL